jgi:hypothetical protein
LANSFSSGNEIFGKIGKPNNFKVLGSMKTKGPKQDSQNQVRSPMSAGGEP